MEIKVEFCVDNNLNHKASISESVGSLTKVFNSEIIAVAFINECTYVYNLDEIKMKLAPENASQIKEKTSSVKQLINN